MRLHHQLGVTQRTVWRMLHRIREAWAHSSGDQFSGPAEADRTFVGGPAKNMHAARRRATIHGRGTVGNSISDVRKAIDHSAEAVNKVWDTTPDECNWDIVQSACCHAGELP